MNNPCEKHLNVRASDGYCPICLLDEIAQLRAELDEMRGALGNIYDETGKDWLDAEQAVASFSNIYDIVAAVLAKYPGGEK